MRAKKSGSGLLTAIIAALFILVFPGAVFSLRVSAEGFSEDISGATGWGTTAIDVYFSDTSDLSKVVQLPAKEPFQILEINNDDMLQIEHNGLVGYVKKDHVLINLPDVEPDILYNLTNATGSIFTATTVSGTVNQKLNLYGTQIYYNGDTSLYYNSDSYRGTAGNRAGKVWNEKLGRYEFVVPILYTAAEKISAARSKAAADGYNFKIYDAYRTNVATQIMNSSFNSLYSQTGGALMLAGYDTGFFVATTLSSHNVGCAIDVTMVRGTEEVNMPTKMHVLSGDAVLLGYSPSGRTSSELSGKSYSYYESNFAGTMTDDAKRMCRYMIDSGLTGLGSEWWHYQDQTAYSLNSGFYSNLASWYPCQLYFDVDAGGTPEVVTRRCEAVYQLWAAAGFPSASAIVSFTDVSEYDYYYNAVCWAVSEGLISGSSGTAFSPNDAITRAGFLKMLYQYCGNSGESASNTPVFEDVSANAWYYSAVQWAAKRGITEETSGTFCPSGVLTQEQMHGFLTRASAAGITLSGNYL